MTSLPTRHVARLMLAPVLMIALAVLVKGYADVGDGFAAGVIAGDALFNFFDSLAKNFSKPR